MMTRQEFKDYYIEIMRKEMMKSAKEYKYENVLLSIMDWVQVWLDAVYDEFVIYPQENKYAREENG